ncbi:MAG: hypothetical protein Q3M30_07415 [Candidatus Electrothrix sp. Rat3]|nr:hypothetical protein [Candidatus Electrothrix rattekaaiensis]
MTVVLLLCLLFVSAQVGFAAGTDIRKFCAPQSSSPQPLRLFLASHIGSQQAALQRNSTLQEGTMLFSTREEDALFYTTRIASGDCVLVNIQEGMQLQAVAASEHQGPAVSNPEERANFLPAVFFVKKSKAKHYGLIAEKTLRRLRPVKKVRETATEMIVNAETDPDLVLIYILCPPDRNSPCDLTVKQNGAWLLDKKTGKQFHLPVLARSQRSEKRDGKQNDKSSKISRRIHINNDTPQGIYTIWGAVTGGGDSPWFRTARIDLDAALPPINAQPYPVNSFLLSRIIPVEALDDYWANEWPLAYSLGRIALRIAPGDFTAEQHQTKSIAFSQTQFSPTHGCINTGGQQGQLLQILIQAGVFRQEDLITPLEDSGKRWSVSPKLGKAFVILKDRDETD